MSVIVNVYNGASTLQETLASIFNQSFTDFELIIWDDCSSDSSMNIVLALNDPRVRIFQSESNMGLGAARWAALAESRGRWVGFVDQDDLWIKTKLADQLTLVRQMPEAGFVYGRALRFFPDGSWEDYDHRHEYKPLPRGDIFDDLFRDSCFIAISTVLFRREVILGVPSIPGEISACPDYFLYLHIARHFTVNSTNRIVCLYRMHENNMSLKFGMRMQQEILYLIDSWSSEIGPELADRRRRVHATVLAVLLLRSGMIVHGLDALFRQGSVSYLISRPFARAFRALRRRIAPPVIQRSYDESVREMLRRTGV